MRLLAEMGSGARLDAVGVVCLCVYVRMRVCNFNFYNNLRLALQAM